MRAIMQGVAITQENSLLDNTARIEGWLARLPMFDWVGGRTSEMSAVGLLPAALQVSGYKCKFIIYYLLFIHWHFVFSYNALWFRALILEKCLPVHHWWMRLIEVLWYTSVSHHFFLLSACRCYCCCCCIYIFLSELCTSNWRIFMYDNSWVVPYLELVLT